MGNCKNCIYFDVSDKKHKFGKCNSLKFIYEGSNKSSDDCLIYWDAESYKAYFEVGRNFGCIHFEKQKGK